MTRLAFLWLHWWNLWPKLEIINLLIVLEVVLEKQEMILDIVLHFEGFSLIAVLFKLTMKATPGTSFRAFERHCYGSANLWCFHTLTLVICGSLSSIDRQYMYIYISCTSIEVIEVLIAILYFLISLREEMWLFGGKYSLLIVAKQYHVH